MNITFSSLFITINRFQTRIDIRHFQVYIIQSIIRHMGTVQFDTFGAGISVENTCDSKVLPGLCPGQFKDKIRTNRTVTTTWSHSLHKSSPVGLHNVFGCQKHDDQWRDIYYGLSEYKERERYLSFVHNFPKTFTKSNLNCEQQSNSSTRISPLAPFITLQRGLMLQNVIRRLAKPSSTRSCSGLKTSINLSFSYGSTAQLVLANRPSPSRSRSCVTKQEFWMRAFSFHERQPAVTMIVSSYLP